MLYKTIVQTKKLLLASAVSVAALSTLNSFAQDAGQDEMNLAIENYLEKYEKEQNLNSQKFNVSLGGGNKLGQFDVTRPLSGNSVVNTVSYLHLQHNNVDGIKMLSDHFSTLASVAKILNLDEVVILHLDGTEGREVPEELETVISKFKKDARSPEAATPDGVLFRDVTLIWTEKTGATICPFTVPVGLSGEELSSSHLDYLKTLADSHSGDQTVSVREVRRFSSPFVSCAGALVGSINEGIERGSLRLTDMQHQQLSNNGHIITEKKKLDIDTMLYEEKAPFKMDYPVLSLSDGTVLHGSNSFSTFFYSDGSVYQVGYASLLRLFKEHYGDISTFPLAAFVPEIFLQNGQESMAAMEQESEEVAQSKVFDAKCESLINKYHFKTSRDVRQFYLSAHADKRESMDLDDQTLSDLFFDQAALEARHKEQQALDADIEATRKCSKTPGWRERVTGYPSLKHDSSQETVEQKRDRFLRSAKPLNEIMDDLKELLTPDFIELVKAFADASVIKTNGDESTGSSTARDIVRQSDDQCTK